MGVLKLEPKIRERRMEAHMTQKELSDKIGMNSTQLSRIENGRTFPSPQTLWEISIGIGCKVDYLYEVVK